MSRPSGQLSWSHFLAIIAPDNPLKRDFYAEMCRIERWSVRTLRQKIVARQKRMTVDDEDYYLDLLFYHRKLRRLVAIDLKIGKFQAADKGQMELYLRWLEENEVQPGEEPPLGLVCAGKTKGMSASCGWRKAASTRPSI